MKRKELLTLIILFFTIFIYSCSKTNLDNEEIFETSESIKYSLSLNNGMLHFKNVEKYNEFLGLSENEKSRILKDFESKDVYTSQKERLSSLKSDLDINVPEVMLMMTNSNNCVLIENRIYRVNDATGKVYSVSSEHVNNQEILSDLINENENSKFVQVNSVDEDLFEISGLPVTKGVIDNGCPTWANGPTPKIDGSILGGISDLNGSSIINCSGYMGSRNVSGFQKYYRGGILFSLYVEGADEVSYVSGWGFNCTDVTAYAEFIYKRRNTSGSAFWSSGSAMGNSGKVKYEIYTGANRLCYYKLRNSYIKYEILNNSGQNIGFVNKFFGTNIAFNYN